MRWARVAMLLGSLLVVAAFCVGVDTPISTSIAGQTYACADVITPGMLVSGQPNDRPTGTDTRTPAERRLDARIGGRCDLPERAAGWVVWGGVGLGGLVLLTGWAALREREREAPVTAAS